MDLARAIVRKFVRKFAVLKIKQNNFSCLKKEMAEGKGFEPPKGISSFNDLANRRLQPLGHPPAGVTSAANKILASTHVNNTRRMLPFL